MSSTTSPDGVGDTGGQRIVDQLRVAPGSSADLAGRDTRWTGGGAYDDLSADELDAAAKSILDDGIEELKDAQELLWASNTYAVLVVFQAMDAAGKDSTIKHVMSGVNPQGVHVVSFKQPSSEELDHDFLWRISKALPARGQIGIFNRSQYEEVVALRVHPEWLDNQNCRPASVVPLSGPGVTRTSTRSSGTWTAPARRSSSSSSTCQRRSRSAASWPASTTPTSCGSSVRATSPCGLTGTSTCSAFEEAITATSTDWAPWYVVPADHKQVMQAMVARILVDTIGSLPLEWPTVSEKDQAANAKARQQLEAEPD